MLYKKSAGCTGSDLGSEYSNCTAVRMWKGWQRPEVNRDSRYFLCNSVHSAGNSACCILLWIRVEFVPGFCRCAEQQAARRDREASGGHSADVLGSSWLRFFWWSLWCAPFHTTWGLAKYAKLSEKPVAILALQDVWCQVVSSCGILIQFALTPGFATWKAAANPQPGSGLPRCRCDPWQDDWIDDWMMGLLDDWMIGWYGWIIGLLLDCWYCWWLDDWMILDDIGWYWMLTNPNFPKPRLTCRACTVPLCVLYFLAESGRDLEFSIEFSILGSCQGRLWWLDQDIFDIVHGCTWGASHIVTMNWSYWSWNFTVYK